MMRVITRPGGTSGQMQYRDAFGRFAGGPAWNSGTSTITASVTGNAGTATALQTARTIGGVSFDGTANITVASATGGFTVSGGDLALGTNSLTMTGSIGLTGSRATKGWFVDLEVTNAIAGSITGNAATVTTNANLTGPITSVGNATAVASQTGTGSTFVMAAGPMLTGTPIAPTAAQGTNTTQLATTAFVVTEVAAAVSGLLDLKGSTDCSTNPNYPAASKGDAYYVTVAGRIGGASGKQVDIGDLYVASADNAGGTEAAVGTSWFVLEHSLVGALLSANNLSDVASADTSITNLGGAAYTGTGGLVRLNTPTLVTPEIGAATGTSLSRTSGTLTVSTVTSGDLVLTSAAALTMSGTTASLTTTSGAITIDGQTGGSLQYNGTDVLAWGSAAVTVTGTLSTTGRTGIGVAAPGATYTLQVDQIDATYSTRFYQPSATTSKYTAVQISGAQTTCVGVLGVGGSTVGSAVFQDTFVTGSETDNDYVLIRGGVEKARMVSGGVAVTGTFSVTGACTLASNTAESVTIGGGATASELRMLEPSAGGTSYVGFKAPALAGNTIYTMPTAFPAADGYVLTCTTAGVQSWSAAFERLLYSQTAAGTALTNSAVATVLGSTTIPANTIKLGTVVRIRYQGVVTAQAGATQLTTQLLLGPTTLTGFVLITKISVPLVTNEFTGVCEIVARAAPGANVAMVSVSMNDSDNLHNVKSSYTASANFATNGDLLVEVVGQWNAADSSSCRLDILNVEILGG